MMILEKMFWPIVFDDGMKALLNVTDIVGIIEGTDKDGDPGINYVMRTGQVFATADKHRDTIERFQEFMADKGYPKPEQDSDV